MTNWEWLTALAHGQVELDHERLLDCADELRLARETAQFYREQVAEVVDAVRKRTVGMKTYGGQK